MRPVDGGTSNPVSIKLYISGLNIQNIQRVEMAQQVSHIRAGRGAETRASRGSLLKNSWHINSIFKLVLMVLKSL